MVRVVELPKTKRCTCYQCKAILEYEFKDMSFSLERDYGGGCDRVARITCPNCLHSCAVSANF